MECHSLLLEGAASYLAHGGTRVTLLSTWGCASCFSHPFTLPASSFSFSSSLPPPRISSTFASAWQDEDSCHRKGKSRCSETFYLLIEHIVIYAKSFARVNSSSPHRKPVIQELGFPHFTDDEILTQKGQATHPRPPPRKRQRQTLTSMSDARTHAAMFVSVSPTAVLRAVLIPYSAVHSMGLLTASPSEEHAFIAACATPQWPGFSTGPCQLSFYPESLAHRSLSRRRDFSRKGQILTSASHRSSGLVPSLPGSCWRREKAGPAGGGKAPDRRPWQTRQK